MGDFKKGQIGHSKIDTIYSGNIVVTIWEKEVNDSKVYYDIMVARQYFIEGTEDPMYSTKIQQRDFDDLILAVTEARMRIRELVWALRKRQQSEYSEE